MEAPDLPGKYDFMLINMIITTSIGKAPNMAS
jgi:hypothetical protein